MYEVCETITFGDQMYGFKKALDKFVELTTNGYGKCKSGGSLPGCRELLIAGSSASPSGVTPHVSCALSLEIAVDFSHT